MFELWFWAVFVIDLVKFKLVGLEARVGDRSEGFVASFHDVGVAELLHDWVDTLDVGVYDLASLLAV